jgi:hypothetical protein
MQLYGRWLKQEARRGRFHFYPLPELIDRLQRSGFNVEAHKVSYAGQAYVIKAMRSAQASVRAA